MKSRNTFYALSMMFIAVAIMSCSTKKKSDLPVGGQTDSISVGKVRPAIDSISVKKESSIDSISAGAN